MPTPRDRWASDRSWTPQEPRNPSSRHASCTKKRLSRNVVELAVDASLSDLFEDLVVEYISIYGTYENKREWCSHLQHFVASPQCIDSTVFQGLIIELD